MRSDVNLSINLSHDATVVSTLVGCSHGCESKDRVRRRERTDGILKRPSYGLNAIKGQPGKPKRSPDSH